MNEPRHLCLICAFSGIEKPASTRRKVFLPHDHTFLALLCPSHEDATPEQIRTAFLTLASDADIRKPLTD
jgi:hypothetical protein